MRRTIPTFRVWFEHPSLRYRVLGTGPSIARAMDDAERRAAARLRADGRVIARAMAPRELDKRAALRAEWS